MGKKIISNKNSFIVLYVVTAFMSIIYILVLRVGILEQNINLDNCSQLTGLVEDRGMDFRIGDKGRTTSVFYVKLAGLEEKLGIYRISGNYDDLLTKIRTGDNLKVYYFDNSNTTENVNIDLIQVEKGHEIIVEKNEYEKKQSSLIYIGAGGLISNMILLYYGRKKHRKLRASEAASKHKRKNNNQL